MSDIPTDEDWVNMEGSGLSAILKRVVGHWGHMCISFIYLVFLFALFIFHVSNPGFQLGGLIFWAVDIAFIDLKVAKSKKRKDDTPISDLGTRLTELKKTHAEKESQLKSDLDAERARADSA